MAIILIKSIFFYLKKAVNLILLWSRLINEINSNLETGKIELNTRCLSSGIYYASWIELDLDKGVEVKKEQFIVIK